MVSVRPHGRRIVLGRERRFLFAPVERGVSPLALFGGGTVRQLSWRNREKGRSKTALVKFSRVQLYRH